MCNKLEMNFEACMALFYRWLDEQRTDRREFRKENERVHREHEERMRELEETVSRPKIT